MKKVILVILLLVAYGSLSAGTPYYEKQINSDGNEYPLVFSDGTLYYLCDRTDQEMQLLKIIELNVPFYYNIFAAKENEPPYKETKKFCIKCNQFPTFYSNSLEIAFTTEVNNKYQDNSIYNQAIYENNSCESSEYSINLNRYGYWSGQAALSPSGKVIIFTSNRKSGNTLDLYASIKDENGSWGAPVYLDQLNTPGDEINPHFGSDGYFYYASNFKNDSISDYDIYRATYIPRDGVLLPIDPKRVEDANSTADDYAPVQSADKFYFSSTRKAENIGANIYSIQNEKGNVEIKIKSNLNEIWVKNVSRAEYLCFPNLDKINLNKGAKYQIIRPEYLNKYYVDKSPKSIEFDFTKTKKDTSVKVDFNLKPLVNNNFVATSGAEAPLFVRGYWKPFNQGTFTELRTLEGKDFFKSTAFVDTTILKYKDLINESENIQDQFLTNIMEALDNYNIFLPSHDSLIINLKILSDEIDISGYKNKYRKPEKAGSIYRGETVKIGKDKKGMELIIPDSLDITKSSWIVKGNKIKLSNNGNEVLAKLRAYYTYKYLDSTLLLISTIYKYYSVNKKLSFNYDGFVINEKGDLPKDMIAISITNHSSKVENDKIENLAKAYDYKVKPEPELVTVSEDPNPMKPVPKINQVGPKISKMKMLRMHNQFKSTSNNQKKQDTTYAVELFNLKDYKAAKRAYDILSSKLVKDIKLLTAYDFLGNRFYLIRADKFATLQEAEDAVRDYKWVYSYVNMEGMATAVRE